MTDVREMRDHRIEIEDDEVAAERQPQTIEEATAAAAARRIERERAIEALQLQETAELLAKAGLDRVPTVEEARAILDARRAEIRQAVLDQADARDWCYDGTRRVCANLRLPKPDDRQNFSFRTKVVLELELQHTGFTEAGALARFKRAYAHSSRPVLSAAWFNYHHSGRMNVLSAIAEPIQIGDETIEVGDKQEEAR